MVDKPKKFTGIPSRNKAIVDAESWVNSGGIDAELQKSSEPEPKKPEPEPESKDSKKFPHRISLDLDSKTYRKLKRKAFDEDCSMNEIVRRLLDEHLK